jgi:hypothetical protein
MEDYYIDGVNVLSTTMDRAKRTTKNLKTSIFSVGSSKLRYDSCSSHE